MKRYQRLCIGLGAAVLCMAGCKGTPMTGENEKSGTEKTEISILYTIVPRQFEALVERTYPDIDLQCEQTTTATMNSYSERRLRKGHGTDLVITSLPTGEVQDYMLDLSAEVYADSYYSTVSKPVMIEGQTRYLPLPGQYSGYIINETLAEKLGNRHPKSNQELTELFQNSREQDLGIGQDGACFGLDMIDRAQTGSYIMGIQIPDFLGLSHGIKWIADLEEGRAGFQEEPWTGCLDMLGGWVEEGYLSSESLKVRTSNSMPIEKRMGNGEMLACFGNVRLLEALNQEDNGYQYQMFPFMSDKGNHPWVISNPNAYIGINKVLGEKKNEKKLDACRRILTLLSTQEGQEAWMEDTASAISYLNDFKADKGLVPEGLEETIKAGYIYSFQMPSSIVQYFGQCMVSALSGEQSLEEALASVDDYWVNGSEEIDYDMSVIGSVSGDLLYEGYNTRLGETAIGNLLADAVRELADVDIAVVNGGGIRASLYKGDVLGADLAEMCPYPNQIIAVEAKGDVIWKMLENGISQTNRGDKVPSGRFLQVSGICYSFCPMTDDKPGELLSVTFPDGTPLDREGAYSLAVTDYMAGIQGYENNSGDGYTMLNVYDDKEDQGKVVLLKETNTTYADALKQYFANHRDEEISVGLEGRVMIVE